MKVLFCDFIQNLSQAPSKCLSKWIKVDKWDYHISANSFGGNYSFLNLEIVENSSSCRKFQFLPDKMNFCCRKYSREETIQARKLFAEIKYLLKIGVDKFQCIAESNPNWTIFHKLSGTKQKTIKLNSKCWTGYHWWKCFFKGITCIKRTLYHFELPN